MTRSRPAVTLTVDGKSYDYFSLEAAQAQLGDVARLPFSLKVLLENLLRFEDGRSVTVDDVKAMAQLAAGPPVRPRDRLPPGPRADAGLHRRAGGGRSRRDARGDGRAGRRPAADQPAVGRRPGDRPLGAWSTRSAPPNAFQQNVELRVRAQRRALRLPALGPDRLRQFPRRAARHRHLPPGQPGIPGPDRVDREGPQRPATRSPIPTRWSAPTATPPWSTAWPCWAGASAASRPRRPCWASRSSMLIPEVIGFKLTGKLQEGVTATDLVLTVTQMLRKKGVVGKFVEFYGAGLDAHVAGRPRHDRQHGARNTAPPAASSRSTPRRCAICASPAATRTASRWSRPMPRPRACGATPDSPDPVFTDTLELDLGTVEPSLAGPKRPQDRVRADPGAPAPSPSCWPMPATAAGPRPRSQGTDHDLDHGDVVIAAITSCTNTSNPSRDGRGRPGGPQGARARPEAASPG